MSTTPYVKFFRGTPEAFQALSNKDTDTLYFIAAKDSNKGTLYLGEKLITDNISTIKDLEDILLTELADGQLLTYDGEQAKWVNKSIIDAIGLFGKATETEMGTNGLVPAPGMGMQDAFLRGDGNWVEIETSSAQIFEVVVQEEETHDEALIRIVNGAKLFKGDIAVVKETIANDKQQYTAYVYNGTAWAAMDGNYRADNVYFDEDFIFTKAIGTVSIPDSGNTTVSAAGKNLQEFFASLFAEEENPTKPSTSASLTSNNIGTKEVGTKISVNYSFSTSSGAYKYGPADNEVEWSGHTATFNGQTLTGASGTFNEVQVTDTTNLSITGSVEQSEGAIPLTNLGNEYPDAQIQAKSWTGLNKGTLKGYRAWFCGYKNGENALVDPTAITGDQIRALGNSANGSWKSSMEISQMKQMYFAAPAGKGYKPSVKDAATTAPQTVLGPITVYVKGANDYVTEEAPNGIAYDVWYVANADAAAGSATVNITRA